MEGLASEGIETILAAIVVALALGVAGFTYRIGRRSGLQESRTTISGLTEQYAGAEADVESARSAMAEARAQRDAADVQAKANGAAAQALRDKIDAVVGQAHHGGALIRTIDWTACADRPAHPIPVIAVGNLKGGVGKTTTAANLGAYLGDVARDGRRGPTLFIDLDFQGSLSSIVCDDLSRDGSERSVARLFDLEKAVDAATLSAIAGSVRHPRLAGSRYFTADFDVSDHEERLFLRWLLGETGGVDPRLALARYLWSPEIQGAFGAVVIDLPPRAGLLAVAGLIAATHVVVATRDDALSTTGAARFAGYLARGRDAGVWPSLKVAGVVVPQTSAHHQSAAQGPLTDAAQTVTAAWTADLPAHVRAPVPGLWTMPRMAGITDAANEGDFAYFKTSPRAWDLSPEAHFAEMGRRVEAAL